MSKGWDIKSLGDICDFRRGLTYSKKDEVPSSKNAVLRANNISLASNALNFDEIRYISDYVDVPLNKKLVKNSVMICTASGSRSHLGKVAYIDKDYDYAFGGFMALLVPDQKVIDPKYFFTILTSGQFRDHIDSLMSGANINNLKFSQIKDYEITVPPISEQKRIVKILDEKFEVIEKLKKVTEEQIKDARELFESRLNEIFESDKYERKLLADLVHIKHGHAFKGVHFNKTEGDILLTPGNFVENGGLYFNERNTKRYSEKAPTDFVLKEGDLVVVMTDLSSLCKILGSPAFVTQRMLHNQRIGLVEIKTTDIDKSFLYYGLLTQSYKNIVKSTATGTTVRHTAPARIYTFPINLPSMKEQYKLVAELDELSDKIKDSVEIFAKKLTDLEDLKKSYLEQAFAGKL